MKNVSTQKSVNRDIVVYFLMYERRYEALISQRISIV